MISTRSKKSEDAHRDFDGFDVDEELARFRAAVSRGDVTNAVELAKNIDENLSRGGPIPVAWLGVGCETMADHLDRLRDALARRRAIGRSVRRV